MLSTWANGSKIRASISGASPTPLSLTRNSACPRSDRTETLIQPPRGVYFKALTSEKLNYRLAYAASYRGLWPVVHIHDSLDETIWIFERDR